jgi:hypothetical protein
MRECLNAGMKKNERSQDEKGKGKGKGRSGSK